MKTLNRYIARKLVLTTLAAVGILTFIMLSANLVKAFELLSRGIGIRPIASFLIYLTPDMLTFTIPMALLCATVLVFNRLSADNEITAMRASGISLWQIISPGLVLSILLSGICFFLHTVVSPTCRYRADQLKKIEGTQNPLALLEPGRFVEVPGYIIRIGEREGNILRDIHVHVLDDENRVRRNITARIGRVRTDSLSRTVELSLEDAAIVARDLAGNDPEASLTRIASKSFQFPMDYGSKLDSMPVSRKLKYMDMRMVFARIHLDSENGMDTTPHFVELHTRMSLALSPFAFLLLGMPFAIRTGRFETSVGLLICLLLTVGFYTCLTLADGMKHSPQFHPEILVWLPNITYQLGGLWSLAKMARH